MFPPSPPRILRFFGDFPPKNPRNFGCPRPRSVPEPVGKCIPVPIPEFRGFSGTGMIFPRNFKLSPSPNCPRAHFKGYPRGSQGIPEVLAVQLCTSFERPNQPLIGASTSTLCHAHPKWGLLYFLLEILYKRGTKLQVKVILYGRLRAETPATGSIIHNGCLDLL